MLDALSNLADRELDSFYVGAVAESQQRDIYIAAQMVEDLAPLLVNSLYFIEQKSDNAYLEKKTNSPIEALKQAHENIRQRQKSNFGALGEGYTVVSML